QLQLEVEEQLFNQDEGSLVEMTEILGIEDDVAGKTRMQNIKIIQKGIDNKLESGEKFARTCLEQLFAYMKGTVPPLEPTGESTEETEQNTGATGVKSGKKSAEGKMKKEQTEQGTAKAASEVYQQLATVCQQNNESPQQFLLRALDLRNKVNFASQESDCEFNYGFSLIQKTFAKSFETGPRDDILASNLRATLRTPGLTDEELMKQVNELASQQAERNTKLATEHQKMTKVNSCEISNGVGEPRSRNPDGDESQKILSEIRQMRLAIYDLQGRVNAQRSQTSKPDWGQFPYRGHGGSYHPKYPSWGCQNCKERGRGEECDHCFACGSSGHAVKYCSRACQKKHWPDHKELCTAISHLSDKAKKPLDPSDSTFVSHLTPQQHATVVGLVGKRCTVNGEINSHSVEVLWDTGAQVSIISNEFLKNFPGVVAKDISELLDTKPNLMAANGSEMPYIGWVELNFRLSSSNPDLKFHFLLRSNVWTHQGIIKHSNGDAALSQVITSSFTDLDTQTASVFVNFIESLNQEELCCIKTTKRDTTILPKQSLRVTCRVNTGPVGRPTPVLFEPDETNPWPNGLEISETLLTVKKGKSTRVDIDITNNTNHEIVLKGRTPLGRLQLVQSVTPVEVKIKEPDSGDNGIRQEAPGSGTTRPVHPLDGELGVASMSKSQDQGQVNWVSALTGDHSVLPADPVGTDTSTVPVIDLKQAQTTDQRGQRPTTGERKRELSETQLLLHEWENLSLDKDGVLRWHKGTRTQIIVPKQLRPLVLKELHENMGHLGTQAATHVSTNSVLGSQLPQCSAPHHTCCTGLPFGHQFQLPTNPILYQHPVIFGYPSSYLQYPLTSPPVFHPGNQYLTYKPVVYQPKDDPMHVPITMDHGHVPVPGYVY
ncbi:hypothetical protein P5673_019039, partial [Acropora cervicornis]